MNGVAHNLAYQLVLSVIKTGRDSTEKDHGKTDSVEC